MQKIYHNMGAETQDCNIIIKLQRLCQPAIVFQTRSGEPKTYATTEQSYICNGLQSELRLSSRNELSALPKNIEQFSLSKLMQSST